MLLGEMHGTREVPRFVALGTCQVASSAMGVVRLAEPSTAARRKRSS